VISSQTPGLPDTRAKGESVQITEMASPYAKQAALWLYYRLISTTLKDTTVAARDGLFVSFSPGHAGMLPGPPVLRAGGR